MMPSESLPEFTAWASTRGLVLASATAREGIEAALEFFDEMKAQGVDADDGDQRSWMPWVAAIFGSKLLMPPTSLESRHLRMRPSWPSRACRPHR